MDAMKVGVIGCGNISPAYFKGCREYETIEAAACADLNRTVAEERAREFGIPKVLTVEELLADPEVDLVVNLTIPQAHAPVNKRALEAGKPVYCEKPFATSREEGKEVLQLAREKGLPVGCAPDTFLGEAIQTSCQLIDDGAIGQPSAAVACMACYGHETWHPNPEFYYQPGGGPLLDMGPYYLTALVNLLGPVKAVSASAKITFPERLITSQPKNGKIVKVETPTYLTGLLEFASGVIGTTIFSFDMRGGCTLPCIEIFGTEGNLAVPDPNKFQGAVRLSAPGKDWDDAVLTHKHGGMRGLGPADMAAAIKDNRPHRASGELAYHIFDIMISYFDSAETGRRVEVESGCARPAILPQGLAPGKTA